MYYELLIKHTVSQRALDCGPSLVGLNQVYGTRTDHMSGDNLTGQGGVNG